MSENEQEQTAAPVISVMGGNPSDDEVAAVVTVLQLAMATPAAAERKDDRPRAGGWRSHTRQMRRAYLPGRDAWRYSGIPGSM